MGQILAAVQVWSFFLPFFDPFKKKTPEVTNLNVMAQIIYLKIKTVVFDFLWNILKNFCQLNLS